MHTIFAANEAAIDSNPVLMGLRHENLQLALSDMAWAQLRFSRTQVDKAGRDLAAALGGLGSESSLEIIDNWRTAHNFPLNTFQVGLRKRAKNIDHTALVAQRIKRLSSIRNKLIGTPNMRLSAMQDIGGCRAVVNDLSHLYELYYDYEQCSIKHERQSVDNYLENPKKSGYRGIHLIYKYFSDRNTLFNNLKIEIQLRTVLQHAWATAVETVDTFTRQSLKTNRGKADWQRFFSLMGGALSNRESTVLVPGVPKDKIELKGELKNLFDTLKVERCLSDYKSALDILDRVPFNSHYYLITLDSFEAKTTVKGFQVGDLERASDAYYKEEREGDGTKNVVLVSADSINALKRAYPNYFLDTTYFMDVVRREIY